MRKKKMVPFQDFESSDSFLTASNAIIPLAIIASLHSVNKREHNILQIIQKVKTENKYFLSSSNNRKPFLSEDIEVWRILEGLNV